MGADRMIEYKCATDGYKFFEADAPVGVLIRSRCKRCRQIVTPVAASGPVFQRTYRCSECDRVQQTECPVDTETYCIVCGTKTLETIDEVRPAEVRQESTVRR